MARRKKKHNQKRYPGTGLAVTWRWIMRESSEEFREWLEGLEQTESRRESFCRAMRLARFLAISKGKVISPEEAMLMIAPTWLDRHSAN